MAYDKKTKKEVVRLITKKNWHINDIAHKFRISQPTIRKWLRETDSFPVWRLNKTEKKAYEYLLSLGYKKIKRGTHIDLFADGKPYEVKTITKGCYIQFGFIQLGIIEKHPNIKILLYEKDQKGIIPKLIIDLAELKEIKSYKMKNYYYFALKPR